MPNIFSKESKNIWKFKDNSLHWRKRIVISFCNNKYLSNLNFFSQRYSQLNSSNKIATKMLTIMKKIQHPSKREAQTGEITTRYVWNVMPNQHKNKVAAHCSIAHVTIPSPLTLSSLLIKANQPYRMCAAFSCSPLFVICTILVNLYLYSYQNRDQPSH